ncbi:MAG: amidohydrolase family protein [Phycisphaerales bacterium]|nr:MAG: amidohydrolase family protein [Phycisphaerales bacterium]
MIVDLNTNIWSSLDQLGPEVAERIRRNQTAHWGQFEASAAAHERAMSCVDAAVVRGFRSDMLEASIPNELIAEFVSKDPGRRVGVAGVDPMSDDAEEQLCSAVALGLAGITISPACQGFHPTHSSAMRIYERCDTLSLPVFVTLLEPLTPSAMLEFGRPALWDEVGRSFPTLKIVISQLGHPWIDEALILLGKHQNVYADIAGVAGRPWQLYNALLAASANGVMGKLMFGSGFPHDTPAKAIEMLYSVNGFAQGTQLPSVQRAQIRGIVERDSLLCLGIEAEISLREGGKPSEVSTPARATLPGAQPQAEVPSPSHGRDEPPVSVSDDAC